MIKRTHSVCLLIKVEKKVQAICLRNVSSNVEHNNVSKIIWDRSLLRPQQKWGYNVHRSLVLSIYNFASTQEDTLHSIHLLEWNKHTYSLFNFAIFCLLGKKATSWEVTCNYAYLHFWSFYLLQAFADQCDAVSRRMGFMPLPLGVVMIRVVSTAFKTNSRGAPVVFLLAYLALLTFRYVLTSQ